MDKLSLSQYDIHINYPWEDLLYFIGQLQPTRIGVLVDENTRAHCWPLLQALPGTDDWTLIEIPAGEKHKNIDTCRHIWQEMMQARFDRRSLLLNLGGGVIGDMGGFCASTFKRGIRFIQIPTTLLAQVDASIGGKLGIDFGGIKNSVGLFRDPEQVFARTDFYRTLPPRELRSGFAEVIKHAIIADEKLWQDLQAIDEPATADWPTILPRAMAVKQRIVASDPYERGLRQILNFGHTIGHAIESFLLETDTPALHGEAIAAGMICEAQLAQDRTGLSPEQAGAITTFIDQHYPRLAFSAAAVPALIELMRQDKKNQQDRIRFALPSAIGRTEFNLEAEPVAIQAALKHYLNG